MEKQDKIFDYNKCLSDIAKIEENSKSVWDFYKILLKNDKKNISPNLREFQISVRSYLGITQEQLSKQFDIKQNAFSRYENGVRKMPFEIFIGLTEMIGYEIVMKKREEKWGSEDESVKGYQAEKKSW